jgi:hypothetical protein
MFCIANVLTICRMTYILAFSPHTGPLIVTLGKMMVVSVAYLKLMIKSNQRKEYFKYKSSTM